MPGFTFRIVCAAAAAALLSPPATALELRRAQGQSSRVVIGSDEVIDDSVLATAETVIVEGTVTGNLLAFGRTVEIRGEVQGDVVTAGESVEASGRVGGNWVSFSRTLGSSAKVYLAKIALAPAIGVALLRREPAGGTKAFVGALALGLGVFWIVRAIPFLGGLASFVVVIVGLGALGIRARELWRGPTAPPAVGLPA